MAEIKDSAVEGLVKAVQDINDTYVRLEVTTRTQLEGLRGDLSEIRESLRDVTRTISDHSARLTAGETRLNALHDERNEVRLLRTEVEVVKNQLVNNAPVKTPWTAVVSAIVALGALAWTLFGR